jgi:membrane protein DedA with SNARE-associated domain
MEALVEQLPYVGVVLILVISGFGLPIPEDVPLIIGGVMCGLHNANIFIMLPLCFAAVLGADLTMFTLGRLHGDRLRRLPLLRRYLSDERLAKVADAYHAHVGKTLFTSRFLPGLRTPLFFTAGSVGVSYTKMILFDGLAALISVPALVLAGYFGAEHKDVILHWASRIEILILFGVVAAVISFFVIKRWRRRKSACVK